MQLSARLLGEAYGLNAEEMNRVLKKLGFLEGEPGNYTPTEKAMKYVMEKDYHRGCGGYSSYNRYWTTRTFDDSITDVLDITDDIIAEVRRDIADVKAARKVARDAMLAQYERDRLDAEAEKAAREEAARLAREAYDNREEIKKNLKKYGKIGLIAAGIFGLCYGAKKAAPHVKKWWNDTFGEDTDTEDNTSEK